MITCVERSTCKMRKIQSAFQKELLGTNLFDFILPGLNLFNGCVSFVFAKIKNHTPPLPLLLF